MIYLRVQPGVEAARTLTAIKMLALDHPGRHALTIFVGARRLELGEAWLYSNDEACRAALSEYGDLVDPRGSVR